MHERSGGKNTRIRGTVVEANEEAARRVRNEECQTPARRAVGRVAFASGGRWRWRGSKMEPESKESGSLEWILFRQQRARGALVYANRGSASVAGGHTCEFAHLDSFGRRLLTRMDHDLFLANHVRGALVHTRAEQGEM